MIIAESRYLLNIGGDARINTRSSLKTGSENMNTDIYTDAIRLQGSLRHGHVVDPGRTGNAGAIMAKETSVTITRGREGVELEELRRKRSLDEALDDALAGTFPASDPVALAVLG
jgi:hypothetical protein